MAGLDAGLVYNSFPKMGERWVPDDVLALSPRLRNFTENPSTVQLDHRVLGTATLAAASALWLLASRRLRTGHARSVAHAVGAMAWLQVTHTQMKFLAVVFVLSITKPKTKQKKRMMQTVIK